jgi:predicted nucleic acid-binding protein
MIIVDTSVWVGHLRAADPELKTLLATGRVLAHPFVTGELALGNLRRRHPLLQALRNLPQAVTASDDEVLEYIERWKLFGLGIGYVDAHLLASARLSAATLWTRDKHLHEAAAGMGCAHGR